jgi:hypothetical protein
MLDFLLMKNVFDDNILSIIFHPDSINNKKEIINKIKEIISSEYILTNKYIYKWNEEKKLWLFIDKTTKNINEIYNIINNIIETYNIKILNNDDIDNIISNLIKNDWNKKLNCKRNLYPIKNGKVINLENLKIRDRNKNDLFSFECDVIFDDSNIDIIEKNILNLFNNNIYYYKKLRKILAYFITGITKYKCFYLFVGNNMFKQKLLFLLEQIMGDFFLCINNIDDLNKIYGKRIVYINNPNIINKDIIDILYNNSTCKYIIPYNIKYNKNVNIMLTSNDQKYNKFSNYNNNYINNNNNNKRFNIYNDKYDFFNELNINDFFSWCCLCCNCWFYDSIVY